MTVYAGTSSDRASKPNRGSLESSNDWKRLSVLVRGLSAPGFRLLMIIGLHIGVSIDTRGTRVAGPSTQGVADSEMVLICNAIT